MNVQFAVKDDMVYILEVNPRASRTVPFVAKVIGEPVAKIAARVMAGEKLASFKLKSRKLSHVAVKEAVFPFNRFPAWTCCWVLKCARRAKSWASTRATTWPSPRASWGLACASRRPARCLCRSRNPTSRRSLPAMRKLVELGFAIKATGGTQSYFESKGIASTKINKVLEGRPHVVDAIKNGDIQLVLNTTESKSSESDSKSIRQTAVMQKVPYYTTLPGILSATKAIAAQSADTIKVRPLQDYFR